MKALVLLAIVMATAAVVGCGKSDAKTRHVTPVSPEYDVVGLAGAAKGEAIAIGTLATFGSFEWGTAPLVTLAAASIKHVPQMLRDHKLTVDEAQGMINGAVRARSLLKAANAACSQNGSGKCAGDQAKAQSLAEQAKTTSVSACLNLSEKEILKCLHH